MNEYTLDVLNVGNAQAIAAYNKESNEVCFVDIGSKDERALNDFMERNHFEKIAICLTHWHEDHFDNISDFVDRYRNKIKFIISPSEERSNKEYSDFCFSALQISFIYKDKKTFNFPNDKYYQDFLNTTVKVLNGKNAPACFRNLSKRTGFDIEEINSLYDEVYRYVATYSPKDFLINQFLNSDDVKRKQEVFKCIVDTEKNIDLNNLIGEIREYIERHNKTVYEKEHNEEFRCDKIDFAKAFRAESRQIYDWLKIHTLMVNPAEYVKRHKEKGASLLKDKNNFGLQYVLEIGRNKDKNYVYIPGDISDKMEHLTIELIEEGKLPLFKKMVKRGFDVALLSHHGSDSANSARALSFFPRLLTVCSSLSFIHGHPSEDVVERLKERNMFYLTTEKSETITVNFAETTGMYVKTKVFEDQIIEMIHNKEDETLLPLLIEIKSKTKEEGVEKFIIDMVKESRKNKIFDFEKFITFLNKKNHPEYNFVLRSLEWDFINLEEIKRHGIYITASNVKEKVALYIEDGGFKEKIKEDDLHDEIEYVGHNR